MALVPWVTGLLRRSAVTVAVAAATSYGVDGVKWVCSGISRPFVNLWNKWRSKDIPQSSLIRGVAEEGELVYKEEVVRYSYEQYIVEYSDPEAKITGIACRPMSAEIQSPEANVIEGGINCSYVTIRLTPLQRGKWACRVLICASKGFGYRRSYRALIWDD